MILDTIAAAFMPRRGAMDFGPLSDFWYQPVGTTSSAGIVVRPDNAMQVSTVYACITLLAEVLGQLDFKVMAYGKDDDSPDSEDREHYLWHTLFTQPNNWQTPIEWEAMGMAHLCLRGNFYNEIYVDPFGKFHFIPKNPDFIKPEQVSDGRVRYIYKSPKGDTRTYAPGEILHIRGMSLDGITGVSVLEYAKNAVGGAIAQETYGASLFKNGGLPAFWIGRPQGSKFTQQARSNFRQGWRRLHGGPENAGNPPILEDGMELHELGLTSRDSQWIESRGFQAIEICRFFRVPPYMIGVPGEAARSIEQMGTEFVRYALGPWATRWCQAIRRDAIDAPEKNYVKVNLEDLEKGDKASRYAANNVAVQGGWKTINEVRKDENLPPVDGGDTPRFPMNMQPAGGGPDQGEQGGQPGKGLPKAPAEQDDGDEPTAYENRKQKNKEAFAALLDDAAARIASSEIRSLEPNASKAAQDRAKWTAWATSRYDGESTYARKVIAPLAKAWATATAGTVDMESIVQQLRQSTSPLFADNADVPAILNAWKTTRAAEVAAILKGAFADES